MSSSVTTTVGGVMVVTHVHPAPQGTERQHVGIQKFMKAWPLALGTVQIMIGLMVLLFGIAMVVNADTLGVYSGAFVWGALIYITAGSLTVAAGKSKNLCLVNGALALCVMAAVASCIATILYSLDAAGLSNRCRYYGYDFGSGSYGCYLYKIRMQGFSGILVVFHFLELVVSITVSGFACCAAYNSSSENGETLTSVWMHPIDPEIDPVRHHEGRSSVLISAPGTEAGENMRPEFTEVFYQTNTALN
ncbi:membrane-spanning 4-domains subfamily A member 4A-like isoform X2 [Toxotes jaculatrix]|uniref:membrane-spanning 4-domains subfamily A member 4A-like isoform X2 n=1 Tax=Toxotes jaculatrix TaxID=941984 RepID=UPI001B3ACCAC|nr:membrane-spanning 4-domains subfamily A member 4A-like isoform X2 [Toxotes jaculatrix]